MQRSFRCLPGRGGVAVTVDLVAEARPQQCRTSPGKATSGSHNISRPPMASRPLVPPTHPPILSPSGSTASAPPPLGHSTAVTPCAASESSSSKTLADQLRSCLSPLSLPACGGHSFPSPAPTLSTLKTRFSSVPWLLSPPPRVRCYCSVFSVLPSALVLTAALDLVASAASEAQVITPARRRRCLLARAPS
jgi:hypothetical protein